MAEAAAEITKQETQQETQADERPVAVEFDHVTKRYSLFKSERKRFVGLFSKRVHRDIVCANDDLSFVVHKGESVALLGPNGAGKSTALKIITGVTYPSEGKVTVNGRVSALLELSAGFDMNLTGRENIYLRGQIWGLSPEEVKKLEEPIAEFADLGIYIDQQMRTYSSGMKSRLGFAFASSINPDILIIDEALSVGDRRFQAKCRDRVKDIMSRSGVTVLLVTHNTGAAKEFCERGLVINKGQLQFDGPVADAVAFYEGQN